MLRFQSASEVSSNGAAEAMPALATTMSTPPIGDDGVAEGGLDRLLVRDVGERAGDDVLAERLAKLGDGRLEARLVDVGEHDAGAFAQRSAAAIARPMPPAPPVMKAMRPASDFGFGMRCSLASSSSQYSMSKASCSARPT